mmetsp:Transcript_828/g.1787  ORF Transcript_828/g.1787 Transcript_828/m.1787 type:complete len:203 (+) Transcript_828:483-1091(+)
MRACRSIRKLKSPQQMKDEPCETLAALMTWSSISFLSLAARDGDVAALSRLLLSWMRWTLATSRRGRRSPSFQRLSRNPFRLLSCNFSCWQAGGRNVNVQRSALKVCSTCLGSSSCSVLRSINLIAPISSFSSSAKNMQASPVKLPAPSSTSWPSPCEEAAVPGRETSERPIPVQKTSLDAHSRLLCDEYLDFSLLHNMLRD